MNIVEVVALSLYITFIIIGLVCEFLPVYKKNLKNFRNFTVFDFISFTFFLPVEIGYALCISPFAAINKILKKRPFRIHRYKVGDKVYYGSKIETVLETIYDSNFEEMVILTNSGGWGISIRSIKPVSPLEKII